MLDCLNFFFVVLFPEVGPYGYKFPLMNRTAFAVSDRFWNTLSIFNCLKVFFYLGFPCGSDSKESACNVGDPGLIAGSGKSLGEGNGNPLQCSYLENTMDGGAWWVTVWGCKELDTAEWLHFLSFFFQSKLAVIFPFLPNRINTDGSHPGCFRLCSQNFEQWQVSWGRSGQGEYLGPDPPFPCPFPGPHVSVLYTFL